MLVHNNLGSVFFFFSNFTCNVVICPKVHLNVVPLENQATVCARSSNRHIHVILEAERVHRQRL